MQIVRFIRPLLAGVVALATHAHAQLVDGGFESGLAGWTAGGNSRVAVLQAANISGGTVNATEGTHFVALSTGPGIISSTITYNLDGNGTNEFDLSTLSQTLVVAPPLAVLQFDWNLPSSEQDQPNTFDDVFDVTATVGATATKIFSRSVCKNAVANFSPYPDSPCNPATVVNWSIVNAAPISGTSLRFGVGAWQHACVALPVTAPNTTVTLKFQVADQGDGDFDTALLLDDVRVGPACDATPSNSLTQVTNTAGCVTSLIGGQIVQRCAAARNVTTDATGTNFALVSSANLTGDNPNLLDQVFSYNGVSYVRATGLAIPAGGAVHDVAMSADTDATTTIKGRYVAISARPNASANDANTNTQIYRWDRSTNTVSTVLAAATSGCENVNVSISGDGARIAWESTCASLTGAGTTRKVMYATLVGATWTTTLPTGLSASTTCPASNPQFDRTGAGDSLVLESFCNLSGTLNNDGNAEIFKYTITGAVWKQVTRTTSTTAPNGNHSPGFDGAGQYVFVLSSCNATACGATSAASNSDNSLEVFRCDTNPATPVCTQLSTTAATVQYLAVKPAIDGINYGYERIDTASMTPDVVGYRTQANAATDVAVAIGDGLTSFGGIAFGMNGTVPTFSFVSSQDFVGTNADGNPELFTGRAQ